jgi:hypothetical protein
MSEKKQKGRVKVERLPQEEKELGSHQTAKIKGGGGNGGISGGDVRSITRPTAN